MTEAVATQSLPRTRAQAIRDKVVIRLALDEMGPAIDAILKANGIELGCKWDKVFPHWLIATVEDDVIACCQVLPAKPVGFVEFMFADPKASFKLRAVAIRKLLVQSLATLRMYGAQFAGGVIAQSNFKFANVLDNMNCVNLHAADVYVKRLT